MNNNILPSIVEIIVANKTVPAAISFAISTSFEYLFFVYESIVNSITEFNISANSTSDTEIIIRQNSI